MKKQDQSKMVSEIQKAIWALETAKGINYKEADYKNNCEDYSALRKMILELKIMGNRINDLV